MRRAALLVVLAALAACRKKAPETDASLVASSSGTSAGLSVAVKVEEDPAWTKAAPQIVERGSRRVAVAVGMAKTGELALARVAAEERARAEIARLLQGKSTGAGVEAAVSGARVTNTFNASDGRVFVELEAPVHR